MTQRRKAKSITGNAGAKLGPLVAADAVVLALALWIGIVSGGVVLSGDGLLEINQAGAAAGGITPSDGPGFPVSIDTAGSYVLTGDLIVPDLNTDAIQILTDHVTIDLNGFKISGPAVCSGSPGSITCSAGSGRAVTGATTDIAVLNGGIHGFAGGGIALGEKARIDSVRVLHNGGHGASVGDFGIVASSQVIGNSEDGLLVGAHGHVDGNTASGNNGVGLVLGFGTGFEKNILNDNGGGAFLGGIPLDDNVCDGTLCRCTGTAEVCDGLDNDCDGSVDEGASWSNLNSPCTVGVGVCERVGVYVCDSGDPSGPAVCSAVAGTGTAEQCDGLDNNCDGSVDEDALWSNLNSPCTVGLGNCQSSGIYVCDSGNPSGPAICSAVAGTGTAEQCDGLDNDCNGLPDDSPTDVEACANQTGVCSGSLRTCGGALGYLPCGAAEYGVNYESIESTCDGLDNDCDSLVDEELSSPPCTVQEGVCYGSRRLCGGTSGWLSCGPEQYGPDYEADETQCDNMDNDCDGEVDEGYQTGGIYDRDFACGSCFIDCTSIYNFPNAYGVCDIAGPPSCVMICCTVGDTNPNCDGIYDYLDLNMIPTDGCEHQVVP
jgi:hypothetical protein